MADRIYYSMNVTRLNSYSSADKEGPSYAQTKARSEFGALRECSSSLTLRASTTLFLLQPVGIFMFGDSLSW